MTSIRLIWLALCLAWISAEVRLSFNSKPDADSLTHREQRSQKRLWLCMLAGLGLALYFKQRELLPIPIDYLLRQLIAIPLFLAGLTVRYWAIKKLGEFFTADVTIHRQHRLITTGLYRRFRHPAYSGILLALLAAGLAMGDCLALLGLTAPVYWAINQRIDIEERLLQRAFGQRYMDYCKRSWKLLPWIH